MKRNDKLKEIVERWKWHRHENAIYNSDRDDWWHFNAGALSGRQLFMLMDDLVETHNAIITRAVEEAYEVGFKRGVTFYERNQKTGEILVRYDEERK